MEDETYATHTHIARVRVMKTVVGPYHGIVHLREVGADPHETEMDFAHEDQARDAARAPSNKFLTQQDSLITASTFRTSATAEAAKTATEIAMWTCRNCNARFAFDQVEAQSDESGFFFICHACDYRKMLVNMGPDPAERPQLIQRNDESNTFPETAMQFDYREFHIDASPLDEGGRYYARAKIYRRALAGGDAIEVKYSGDLGDYPSDADAIEAAQRWAIHWCDNRSG